MYLSVSWYTPANNLSYFGTQEMQAGVPSKQTVHGRP